MESAKSLLNSRKAWVVAVVVCLCFCVNEMAEQRVPPILPLLSADMGLDALQGGYLQSSFGWASLIAALPAGWLLEKLKPKLFMIFSVALAGLGGVIGGLTESYNVLMVARFISGFGVGAVAVGAATVLDEWFTPEKRGLPNAIMIACYPLACIFMLNTSAHIANLVGWHGVWWVGAVLCVATCVIAALLLPSRTPYREVHSEELAAAKQVKRKMNLKVLLTNRSLWCVILGFVCFDIAYVGLMTYAPSMMVDKAGVDLATADSVASILNVVNMFVVILNGVLLGKVGLKNRKWLPAIGLLGLGIGAFGVFHVTTIGLSIAFMMIAGLFTSFISSSFFTIGPDCIPRAAYISAIVALVTFGQNLGVAVGPIFTGAIVTGSDWSAAGLPVLAVCIIGAVLCAFIKVQTPEEYEQTHPEN